MPAVVLEALSHRCPVLVSDIQEHLDIIQSAGQTYGFVHKNKSVSDLHDRLVFLMSHREVVEPLRESGAKYVNQEFSWDKAVRMTYDIYKRVAG